MQDIPDDLGPGDIRKPASVVVRSPGAGLRLDAETRRRIGFSLRVLYGDLLVQPIPERFAVLVAELAARSDRESAR